MLLTICILLATSLVGCSSSGRGRDAGVDAHESGVDAGRDVGPRDSGSDVLRRDVGPDGGRDAAAVAGGWTSLVGPTSSGCLVEYAARPEETFMPAWESCGIANCDQLDIDGAYTRAFGDVGAHDGTRGYFVIGQSRNGGDTSEVLIAATDGAPVGVWRRPRFVEGDLCTIGPIGIGRDHGAFALLTGSSSRGNAATALYYFPFSNARAGLTPVATLAQIGAQHITVSDSLAAAEMQPAGYVHAFDTSGAHVLANLPGALAGVPQNVNALGDHLFWDEWGDGIRVAHATLSVRTSLFRSVDAGDVRGFSSDGTDMVWLQAYYPRDDAMNYARVELWSSPYAESPDDLRPRLVRALSAHYQGKVGGGLFAYGTRPSETQDELVLVRLRDGAESSVPLPTRWKIADILYVTANEILLSVYRGDDKTVFRLAVASLPFSE